MKVLGASQQFLGHQKVSRRQGAQETPQVKFAGSGSDSTEFMKNHPRKKTVAEDQQRFIDEEFSQKHILNLVMSLTEDHFDYISFLPGFRDTHEPLEEQIQSAHEKVMLLLTDPEVPQTDIQSSYYTLLAKRKKADKAPMRYDDWFVPSDEMLLAFKKKAGIPLNVVERLKELF